MAFEHTRADRARIDAVEKRRAEVFTEFAPTSLSSLVQQWRFLDLWPCTARELHSVAHYTPFTPARGPPLGGSAAVGLARKQIAAKATMPDVTTMSVYPPKAGPAAAAGRAMLPAFLQQLVDALPPTPALAALGPFDAARAQELMDSIVGGVPDEMPPYLAVVTSLRSLKRGPDDLDDRSGSDEFAKRKNHKIRHTAS